MTGAAGNAGENSCENPRDLPPVRWFHLLFLAMLLLLGGAMRLYEIDRESLSLDEYWALYLATGRGNQVFEIPYGVIVDSPPNISFAGAPPWWHIWTGLATTTHPPMYHVILRWWVDLFGPSDRAIRALSCLFSLGASALLFDAVRRSSGPWAAMLAAAMMIFATAQLDSSQTVRPYTMLMFFGAGLCDALIARHQRRHSTAILIAIAATTAALALTHYFAIGAIIGAGLYTLIRFKGKPRTSAIGAMAAGLLFAAVVWGPIFWKTRHLYDAYQNFWKDPAAGIGQSLHAIVQIPIRLLLDPSADWRWLAALPLALLIYVIPLFRFRKQPHLLLWWLWIIGTIAVVAIVDLLHHSTMVGVLRYVLLASPALYAILATIFPRSLGIILASVMLLCSASYVLARLQAGPEPGEDWKTMARLIDQTPGPRDVVAILGYYNTEPAFDYFVVAHYTRDWKRPVIFLMNAPDERAVAQLTLRPHVWMVGHSPRLDTARMLPGWTIGESRGIGKKNAVWMVLPPPTAAGKR